MARCGRLPGLRGLDAASRGASGGIKGAKGGQPARLGLWDKGRERENWHGRVDPGLACVTRRGCVRVLVCGLARSCPRPRPGWIRVWVDRLPGGCPNGKERERARSREARSAGSSVCVSGPVAQHWSRLAPTGMRLLSAAQAAPCSTRRWPPGKRGEKGQKSA